MQTVGVIYRHNYRDLLSRRLTDSVAMALLKILAHFTDVDLIAL